MLKDDDDRGECRVIDETNTNQSLLTWRSSAWPIVSRKNDGNARQVMMK